MENGPSVTSTTVSTVLPRKSFRDVIQNFSPAWFAVNMGTGVIGSLFHSFPYGGNTVVLNAFALAFFVLNLFLFSLFLALTISRYVMFPRLWDVLLRHPVQSLYLGCFPMGGATLISVGVAVVSQYWGFGGIGFLYVLWAFWWLDALLSFVCCFGLLHVMTTRHQHSTSTVSPLWLLPVVTLIVCSTSGQLLAEVLIRYSVPHAFLTIGVSIVMVVIGISLAFTIMTIYFRRLVTEGLPDVGVIMSSFVPLGPCGQAGYSLLLAGENLRATVPWGGGRVLGDELVGRILNVVCFFAAFILWCIGLWWLVSAIIGIVGTVVRGKKIAFKLAFWGLVFPNGVQALLTIELAVAIDGQVLRVVGSIYAAVVVLIWSVLAVPTVQQVFDTSIFDAPCLEDELMQLSIGRNHADDKRER